MTLTRKHIAIVGAGLVGSLLSIYLKKRGYNVTVFERRDDIRIDNGYGGRSINLALSTRGVKALEEVGMAAKLKSMAIPMHGRTMHDLSGNLSYLPYGKEGQFINSISRRDLNVMLLNEAEDKGVTFIFNERCKNVDFDKTKITFYNTVSNTETSHSFDIIIGADGAFSAVRSAMQYTDRFDFSQRYIEHGYKELHIPSGSQQEFLFEKNSLHIWPRESFMMIALPNPDASFTCTLFFPFEGLTSFNTLNSDESVSSFFRKTFPDAYPLMPSLLKDFNSNPTSSLVTVQCFPWTKNKTLLIGDAAHAIVPFYGQGMNAGFEDCRILNHLLAETNDNWEDTLEQFQVTRKEDADAIAKLALDNFIEMRDLVADAGFLLRKKIEAKLHERYPGKWIPLYSMVTFHDNIRYSEAYERGEKQKEIMNTIMARKGIESTWQDLDLETIVQLL